MYVCSQRWANGVFSCVTSYRSENTREHVLITYYYYSCDILHLCQRHVCALLLPVCTCRRRNKSGENWSCGSSGRRERQHSPQDRVSWLCAGGEGEGEGEGETRGGGAGLRGARINSLVCLTRMSRTIPLPCAVLELVDDTDPTDVARAVK